MGHPEDFISGARVLLLVPRGGGGKGTGESHVQLGSQQTCGLI